MCDRIVVVYSTDALSNSKFRLASHFFKKTTNTTSVKFSLGGPFEHFWFVKYYFVKVLFFIFVVLSSPLGRLLPCYKFSVFSCFHSVSNLLLPSPSISLLRHNTLLSLSVLAFNSLSISYNLFS